LAFRFCKSPHDIAGWLLFVLPGRRYGDVLPALAGLLALLFTAVPAAAQDGAGIPYGQGVLWRIEGPGPEPEPSYLFGTIHVTDERVHDLPPAVKALMQTVDSLTVEVRLDAAATMAMAGAMLIDDGPGLDALLGPDDFARLAAIAEPYGIPAPMLPRLAPWGAAMAIALPAEEYQRVAGGAPVLDSRLQEMAAARDIPIHALETIEEQIDALSGLPQHHQLTMLRQVIAVHGDLDGLFEGMIELYLQRDIGGVQERLVAQSAGPHEELVAAFLERLIHVRNRRMVARMAPRLAEGNALIAVGALHLPDEQGVLALLAAEGYDVERVY
jgi:uncharacterized protein YbaP (TraB family)